MIASRTPRILVACLLLAGCAGPALKVDDVLADDFTPEDQATTVYLPLAAFDLGANAARERAAAPGAGVAELVDASRSLFFAADARVQIAALETLDASADPDLETVVSVDDRASDRVRAEVESLTRAGKEYAERALPLAPDDADALLYRGLNTSLLAWSVGKQRALFEGLGKACDDATRAALAAGEAHGSGAALRLRGRFLSKAPWPVGDREEGLRQLRRSTEVASVRLNWLFLGDALHANGDAAGALDAWQRAYDADSDEDSTALAPYHRELAQRRLDAAREGARTSD
ncbi:MAG: hypothetical protein H6831_15960 [Planctomycetes bacterium]|nr:hypothetical protein [Planctomycetota bacterium]MCB9905895.1 hypothetical protein [Planctomycetota bacterium]